MAQPRVAVVMPAYNEGEGLGAFLQEIDEWLAPHTGSLVYVIVDDASVPPLELPIVLPHSASSVDLVVNAENLGHGPSALRAYRRGLEHRPDIVIHVDGDGQFLGQDFISLLRAAEQGYAAHGVRRSRTDPWFRRALSWGLKRTVARRHGPQDVNTPLRAYPAHAIAELLTLVPKGALVPHVHFSMWETWSGIVLREIPVTHRVRRGETSTGTTWQTPRVFDGILPSWRLVRFCWAAAREVTWMLTRRRFGLALPTAEGPVEAVSTDKRVA